MLEEGALGLEAFDILGDALSFFKTRKLYVRGKAKLEVLTSEEVRVFI